MGPGVLGTGQSGPSAPRSERSTYAVPRAVPTPRRTVGSESETGEGHWPYPSPVGSLVRPVRTYPNSPSTYGEEEPRQFRSPPHRAGLG